MAGRQAAWAGCGEAVSPDWARFLDAVGEATAAYRSVGLPDTLTGSDWWGSSDNFVRELRAARPGLMVPEHDIVPLTGKTGWTPSDEMTADGGCRKCDGAVEPGSLAYCPACEASGFDRRLERQRALAGEPPPEPRPTKYRPEVRKKSVPKIK